MDFWRNAFERALTHCIRITMPSFYRCRLNSAVENEAEQIKRKSLQCAWQIRSRVISNNNRGINAMNLTWNRTLSETNRGSILFRMIKLVEWFKEEETENSQKYDLLTTWVFSKKKKMISSETEFRPRFHHFVAFGCCNKLNSHC